MANTFYPKPTIGGNSGTWATYLDMLVRGGGLGALTAELYNDSGTLKLSKGKIGISDGVVEGMAVLDTITTISTAGMTASRWHAVEMSVSGSSVTIAIVAIAGASDEWTIDAATKAAYDYEKAGYYLTASKRLIGVVYLRAALFVGRIVNCENNRFGFKNIKTIEEYIDYTITPTIKYMASVIVQIGDWNMRVAGGGSVSKSVALPYYQKELGTLFKIYASIISDAGGELPLYHFENAADPGLITGGIYNYDVGFIYLQIRAGSLFDSVNYDSSPFNRGFIYIDFET